MGEFRLDRQFFTQFKLFKGKTHECRVCHQKLTEGEDVLVQMYTVFKWYPGKGQMGFPRTYYTHRFCAGSAYPNASIKG